MRRLLLRLLGGVSRERHDIARRSISFWWNLANAELKARQELEDERDALRADLARVERERDAAHVRAERWAGEAERWASEEGKTAEANIRANAELLDAHQRIADLEAKLAEATRRAEVAESVKQYVVNDSTSAWRKVKEKLAAIGKNNTGMSLVDATLAALDALASAESPIALAERSAGRASHAAYKAERAYAEAPHFTEAERNAETAMGAARRARDRAVQELDFACDMQARAAAAKGEGGEGER